MTKQVLISVTIVLVCHTPTQATDIGQRVEEAWSRRAQLVHSGNVVFDIKRVVVKGSLNAVGPVNGRTTIPPVDVTLHSEGQVLFLSDYLRYTTEMVSVGPAPRFELSQKKYISSFDGDSSRMLTGLDSERMQGSIRNEKRNTDAISRNLVPLMWSFRGLHSVYNGIDSQSLLHRGESVVGRTIAVVVDFGANRFWLDPARDLVILRWQQFNRTTGVAEIQADIQYKSERTAGWVPESWRVTSSRAGSISEVFEARITLLQINPALSKSDFHLEFPAGTRYLDHVEQQFGVAGRNGSLIAGRDAYDRAMLGVHHWSAGWIGWLGFSGVVACLLVGVYLLQRANTRRVA